MNLFVYGELTRAKVLFELLGRLPAGRVAVLRDHSRRPDPLTGHFVARPSAAAEIAGLLLLDLRAADFLRLDEFEGVAAGDYRRARVEVLVLEPRELKPAEVYLAGHGRE